VAHPLYFMQGFGAYPQEFSGEFAEETPAQTQAVVPPTASFLPSLVGDFENILNSKTGLLLAVALAFLIWLKVRER